MNSPSSKPTALISVSDKTNIIPFAKKLVEAGYLIVSTGRTAKALEEEGLPVKRVSDVTDFPEILNGRVKTLHPKIHGALLADRNNQEHLQTMEAHNILDIQIVCVNLYPFQEVVKGSQVNLQDAIENIDIGGPTMIRAAAKNYTSLTVICDASDYDLVADAIQSSPNHDVPLPLRQKLAVKAFKHTMDYDTAIYHYLNNTLSDNTLDNKSTHDSSTKDGKPAGSHAFTLPQSIEIDLAQAKSLRYGENPHQAAAIYHRTKDNFSEDQPLREGYSQLNGKELSYNNLIDLDAALQLVAEFEEPTAVIIKHTNPAGCATSGTILEAFEKALACDPVSAFGGIVSLNRCVSKELAEKLSQSFYEIISAPDFDDDALEILKKKKSLRVIKTPERIGIPPYSLRILTMGALVQTTDPSIQLTKDSDLTFPTKRKPTDDELASLLFAWRVCKHVKSNAIVLAKGGETVGIGAGQMSRIDSVQLAAQKANVDLEGCVLASDAFFPFRDGPDAAAEFGVTAIIQPGGSVRDQEVIDACNEHDIAMVFVGMRHFRH